MTTVSYFLGIVLAGFTLVVVFELLRRRRLRERHATWWVIAGVVALILAIFPGILDAVSRAVGITLPVNLIFFLSLLVLFLVCIQQSVELTEVEAKTRTLAEEVALLRLQFEELTDRDDGRPPQFTEPPGESHESVNSDLEQNRDGNESPNTR